MSRGFVLRFRGFDGLFGARAYDSSPASGGDRGTLGPGGMFLLRLNQTGNFAYTDRGNPLNDDAGTVEPSAPAPGTRLVA